MPAFVLVSVIKLTARYHTLSGFLELEAQVAQGFVGPAQFRQLTWYGALKFALQAANIRIPPKSTLVPLSYTVAYKLKISFPIPNFDNKNVFVETSDGLQTVPIEYVPFTGPDMKSIPAVSISTSENYSDVLRPIPGAIEGPFGTYINAEVPPKEKDVKSSVGINFNEDFMTLVSANAQESTIEWGIEWNKYPAGQGESPQPLDVTTNKVWREGIAIISSRTVQCCEIYLTNIPPNPYTATIQKFTSTNTSLCSS